MIRQMECEANLYIVRKLGPKLQIGYCISSLKSIVKLHYRCSHHQVRQEAQDDPRACGSKWVKSILSIPYISISRNPISPTLVFPYCLLQPPGQAWQEYKSNTWEWIKVSMCFTRFQPYLHSWVSSVNPQLLWVSLRQFSMIYHNVDRLLLPYNRSKVLIYHNVRTNLVATCFQALCSINTGHWCYRSTSLQFLDRQYQTKS